MLISEILNFSYNVYELVLNGKIQFLPPTEMIKLFICIAIYTKPSLPTFICMHTYVNSSLPESLTALPPSSSFLIRRNRENQPGSQSSCYLLRDMGVY